MEEGQNLPRIVIWDDIVMMTLAILSGYLLVLELTTKLTTSEVQLLDRADLFIALTFLTEFTIKFLTTREKLKFFKSHWWELLAAIPVTTPATQALRLLRLMRLVRLVRLARLGEGVREIFDYLEQFVKQTHLVFVVTVWSIIVFSGAIAFYSFEHVVNPHVNGIFDSLWWAMSTVTTIGYGDIYPVSVGGRIVAMFLMMAGIGTSAVFTALVASFLIRPQSSQNDLKRSGESSL